MRETLASLVEDWRGLGTETAVVAHRGNRRFATSYGTLATLAGRFAAALESRGLQPGDRVLLWGENSREWMAAFFGCLLRGVLVVPLDAAGSASFAERVIAETAPKLVVGDPVLLARVQGSVLQLGLGNLLAELPERPLFQVSDAVVEGAPFQIVFTSGTTSEPKGVVHTHRNVLASLRPIESEIGKYQRYERWVHPLRFLHTLPFSHVFGQFMGLWIPALLGAEIHLPTGVEPARSIRLMRRERISVMVAVPRVLELLRDYLTQQDSTLSSRLSHDAGGPAWKRWWRFRRIHASFGFKFWAFICGGATLPAELEAFWNGLGFALIQGYGMTETAALVTLNHPFKMGRGSLGRTLPGREVRLSEQGEILVRGDVLAAGSWKHGRYEPRAGEWLATGDLAEQGANGELRFAGRRGDVIVTAAGMNVHPQDLEAALGKQAGVRRCAVVACETGTEVEPVAVVLYAGAEGGLRDAVVKANLELAPYQQIRRALVWPEPSFPYTSTGKLLRRQIADWACAALRGTRQTQTDASSDALVRALGEVSGTTLEGAGDQSRVTEDFGLDSLGRVQLQSALGQRFGVEISDAGMAAVVTLGDLRALLGQSPGLGLATASLASGGRGPATASSPNSASKQLPYVRWPWSAPVRWVRSVFLEAIAMPLVRLLAHPRLIGEGREIDRQPMLLIANHVNTYDLPLLLYALSGARRRRTAVAMSGEILADLRYGRGQGNRLFQMLVRRAYWALLALFNVFPLPRGAGFRESFAHAGEALDRGYSVLVFPEGRRSWTGELQPFRPGIGLLVRASQVPVLPMAIQGAGTASRRETRWFRPPGLAIQLGAPLTFSPEDGPEAITAVLETAVRALRPS